MSAPSLAAAGGADEESEVVEGGRELGVMAAKSLLLEGEGSLIAGSGLIQLTMPLCDGRQVVEGNADLERSRLSGLGEDCERRLVHDLGFAEAPLGIDEGGQGREVGRDVGMAPADEVLADRQPPSGERLAGLRPLPGVFQAGEVVQDGSEQAEVRGPGFGKARARRYAASASSKLPVNLQTTPRLLSRRTRTVLKKTLPVRGSSP